MVKLGNHVASIKTPSSVSNEGAEAAAELGTAYGVQSNKFQL